MCLMETYVLPPSTFSAVIVFFHRAYNGLLSLSENSERDFTQ